MATVILSAAGAALGGPLGAGIGRVLGAVVDSVAVRALTPGRQVGSRLTGLQLSSTAEGRAHARRLRRRARVGGQVIWAARFKEKRVSQSTGGGKGGGPPPPATATRSPLRWPWRRGRSTGSAASGPTGR